MRLRAVLAAIGYVAGGCAVALLPRVARADATDDCIGAAELAQPLRRDGHLKAARERLISCARSECPAAVRSDCTKWLTALESVVPSIVVRAVDGAGADLVDVRVSVDGTRVASRIDGNEIEIDPGEHTLRFEREGSAPIEQTLVLRLAEQRRMVSVTFSAASAAGGASSGPTPVQDAGAPAGSAGRASPAWPIVVMGAGGALLGLAAYFWISGHADHETMQSTCAPTHMCVPSAVDSAHGRLVAGDVLGASGVGLAALGGAWLVVRGRDSPPTTVAVQASPQAAALYLRGSF